MANGNCSNQGIKARCINLAMDLQVQIKNTQQSIDNDISQLPIQTEEMKISDIKMIQAFGVPLLNSDGNLVRICGAKYGNE